jgi:anthranilate/para-aminobenzoate synthase component II
VVRARSFRTEVLQDDAGVVDFVRIEPLDFRAKQGRACRELLAATSEGKQELWYKLGAWRLQLMVFVLDNYDSFTYNLVQYLGELGAEVEVRRNDQTTPAEVEAMRPERIVLSPGPCTPLLGVCLGHQAIGAAFGGTVIRAPHLMHGKTSQVQHDGKTIFGGLPSPMTATRYHSLIVEEKNLPADLEVSAYTTERDGSRTIMGLRHRKFPVEGVQFHPESVLTDEGKKLVENFLRI